MPEGIIALEEAFASAAAESDLVQSDVSETTEPVVEEEVAVDGEHADDGASDQPDVAETPDAESDMQSLVDDMLEGDDESPDTPEAESTVDLSTTVEVDLGNGVETVTIQQLVDSGLRQADYTRKTQELAAQRKDSEEAIEFFDEFNRDPIGFARLLAEKAGLVEPSSQPVRQVEAAKIQTAEELEAEITRQVEERIAADPRIQQATIATAQARVDAEFGRIEAEYDVTLSPELRQEIIDEAAMRGTGDVELVFQAKLARAQRDRSRTEDKRKASTSRPKAAPPTASEEPADDPIDSIESAFQAAKASVG